MMILLQRFPSMVRRQSFLPFISFHRSTTTTFTTTTPTTTIQTRYQSYPSRVSKPGPCGSLSLSLTDCLSPSYPLILFSSLLLSLGTCSRTTPPLGNQSIPIVLSIITLIFILVHFLFLFLSHSFFLFVCAWSLFSLPLS